MTEPLGIFVDLGIPKDKQIELEDEVMTNIAITQSIGAWQRAKVDFQETMGIKSIEEEVL